MDFSKSKVVNKIYTMKRSGHPAKKSSNSKLTNGQREKLKLRMKTLLETKGILKEYQSIKDALGDIQKEINTNK